MGAPKAPAILGGSGDMLPRKILKSENVISYIFRDPPPPPPLDYATVLPRSFHLVIVVLCDINRCIISDVFNISI